MRHRMITKVGFASVVMGVLLAAAPRASADMPSAHFDNLDKRAFALGEINGYLSICGDADALRHRAVIAKEATADNASEGQMQALIYAFDKGLSAGATAAPLQFKGCTQDLLIYLMQKNEALSVLEKQSRDHEPKK
jgi:predicted secreted protein